MGIQVLKYEIYHHMIKLKACTLLKICEMLPEQNPIDVSMAIVVMVDVGVIRDGFIFKYDEKRDSLVNKNLQKGTVHKNIDKSPLQYYNIAFLREKRELLKELMVKSGGRKKDLLENILKDYSK